MCDETSNDIFNYCLLTYVFLPINSCTVVFRSPVLLYCSYSAVPKLVLQEVLQGFLQYILPNIFGGDPAGITAVFQYIYFSNQTFETYGNHNLKYIAS